MALSSVATTNQLGFVRHAAWVTRPDSQLG